MKKRLLAILLTVCAAMVLLSTAVFATDAEVAKEAELKTAVSNGGTIKLTDNITMTESMTIASGTTVTIDLNGKNITGSGYGIVNNGTLTIQDTSDNPGTIQVSGTSVVYNTGSIEVKSGKLLSTNGCGIYSAGTSPSVTISGGTVEGWRGILAVSGEVKINGGKVIGRQRYSNSIGVFVDGSGTKVTMTGGAVTCSSYYGVLAQNGATAEISGGTVSGALITAASGTLTITGGTFSSDPTTYASGKKVVYGTGGYTVSDSATINEANAVAKIEDEYYGTLAAAFAAAKDKDTITLLKDITNPGTITFEGKKLNLAMADHTIAFENCVTGFWMQNGGGLTLTGTGTITGGNGAFALTGTSTSSDTKTTLDIGENITVKDGAYTVSVYPVDTSTAKASYGVVVNIDGTVSGKQPIYVHGNVEATGENVPVININSTAKITATGDSVAAYFAGYADTTIAKGAEFSSKSNVLTIAAGKLTVNGGTFIGGDTVGDTESVGGSITTTESTAVYIKQHTTKLPVTVTINDGTFTASYALMEEKNEKVTTPNDSEIKIYIKGGEFTTLEDGAAVVSKQNAGATLEITGGTFSTEPSSDYLASDYISTYENGVFTVIKKTDLKSETLNKPATGIETTISKELSGLATEKKEELTTAAASVSVPSVVNDEAAKAVQSEYDDTDITAAIAALKSDSDVTVGQNDIVTVYSQLYMDVEVTAYNETTKTVTMDITPMVRLVASTAASADKIVLTSTEGGAAKNAVAYGAKKATVDETETVEVSVTLPSEFKSQATVYVQHDASSGGTYYYKSSTNENGEMTFTSDHGFCPFTFSLEDSAAAWIGANGYDSLQEAVDVVGNNGEIDVTNENSDTIYVGRTVTFTINGTFKGKVVASNIYTTITTKDVTGGTEYTCVYTAPSVPVYRVVVNDAEGGKIKASANKAAEGATIVLTPVADDEEGALENLAVVDENGNAVTLTKRANGTYSFVMPAKAVTVTGTFTIVADPEEPDEDEEPGDEEEEATVFTDVDEDAYYAEAVAWAVANEITKGTSETTFSPDDDCTRAQVVTFLWRYAGKPEPTTTENPFTDVEEGTDYYKAILWAYENGITTGTSETTFSPDDTCTRAQVVTFLWRYEGELTYEEAETFTDVAEDAYYAKAVAWAVHEWITNGTGDGQFSPDETCSRGQVVTFLYRDTAEG
jgi:hypothetical protein